jgi:chromate reductase, NAD(P)H dehydrogenase (quinone)
MYRFGTILGNFIHALVVVEAGNSFLMYTIVSGTNRTGSNTLRVAELYRKIMGEKGIPARVLSLEGIDLNQRGEGFEKLEREVLIPTDKFIFILPEYNGSYPGALKTFIDLSDIRKVWPNKKALLTGVSTGRAGNLRGLDHLTGSLNYLKVHVHPNKLPISSVDKLMDEQGMISDKATLEVISKQLDEFINY